MILIFRECAAALRGPVQLEVRRPQRLSHCRPVDPPRAKNTRDARAARASERKRIVEGHKASRKPPRVLEIDQPADRRFGAARLSQNDWRRDEKMTEHQAHSRPIERGCLPYGIGVSKRSEDVADDILISDLPGNQAADSEIFLLRAAVCLCLGLEELHALWSNSS